VYGYLPVFLLGGSCAKLASVGAEIDMIDQSHINIAKLALSNSFMPHLCLPP
jgi:hypothetical protein